MAMVDTAWNGVEIEDLPLDLAAELDAILDLQRLVPEGLDSDLMLISGGSCFTKSCNTRPEIEGPPID